MKPDWMNHLEDEDLSFIKKFVLASGSLKEMAREYDVSYPTVRLRLDRLIQKIRLSEEDQNEPFIAMIKEMAIDEKIDYQTAKEILDVYRKQIKKYEGGKS